MEQRELNDFLAPYEREAAQGASTPFALQYTSLSGASFFREGQASDFAHLWAGEG